MNTLSAATWYRSLRRCGNDRVVVKPVSRAVLKLERIYEGLLKSLSVKYK